MGRGTAAAAQTRGVGRPEGRGLGPPVEAEAGPPGLHRTRGRTAHLRPCAACHRLSRNRTTPPFATSPRAVRSGGARPSLASSLGKESTRVGFASSSAPSRRPGFGSRVRAPQFLPFSHPRKWARPTTQLPSCARPTLTAETPVAMHSSCASGRLSLQSTRRVGTDSKRRFATTNSSFVSAPAPCKAANRSSSDPRESSWPWWLSWLCR